MDGINRVIFEKIHHVLPDYGLEACDIALMQILLNTPPERFELRSQLAICISDRILSRHDKEAGVTIGITQLAEIERQLTPIMKRSRDHVVHSVLTFLLGIYLKEELHLNISSRLEWKLCALLHDVGYPFEMAFNLPREVEDGVNDYGASLHIDSPKLKSYWRFENLEKLTDRGSSLKLISERLTQWGLSLDTDQIYSKMAREGRLNHGIISALLIMKLIDMLYSAHNPQKSVDTEAVNGVSFSYRYFDTHIVNACSAIFLHNLNDEDFGYSRLDFTDDRLVLPALLKLADEMQDWERPGRQGRKPFSANNYNIQFNTENRQLTFAVPHTLIHRLKFLENHFLGIDLEVVPMNMHQLSTEN
jgi:hypothetical protein